MAKRRKLIFVWENFGPSHDDRCRELSTALGGGVDVIGLELFSTSTTYGWETNESPGFKKITLFPGGTDGEFSSFFILMALLRYFISTPAADIFMCNYEKPHVFLASLIARCFGHRLWVMNDSKYDDYQRSWLKEGLKIILYWPYSGALTGSHASKSYLNFLGFKKRPVVVGYNAIDGKRLRNIGESCSESKVADRFTVVSRLVPKKNLFHLLKCYAKYSELVRFPLPLHILGNGFLEKELKALAHNLGVDDRVVWHGFAQATEVAECLAMSKGVLLLSTEEQYGIAIAEAISLGVPVIVTTAVGCRDLLVQSGVNGFVVEPDNIDGTAHFMKVLHEDDLTWSRMSNANSYFQQFGDTDIFVKAVKRLTRYE